MIVLDEEKLSLLLKEIARGFVKSPFEIFLFFILVLAIVAFFILFYRYQVKKYRAQNILKVDKLYKQFIRKKAINRPELDILERLAKYLHTPLKKNLLIENQHTFNRCARKLQEEEWISSSSLAALRMKLGFKTHDPEQIPHSTAELSDNLPVIITQKGRKTNYGKILEIEPNLLCIELGDASLPPRSGLPIQICFENPSGFFSFSTSIKRVGKGIIQVAHSENIKRLQRRKFYRKKLLLPVYIKLAGSHEPPVRSTLIELGGGGASLTNEEMRFQEGDEICLSFFASDKARLNINAEVIRLSGGGKTLHVNFGHMPESNRDRIIGMLFRKRKR